MRPLLNLRIFLLTCEHIKSQVTEAEVMYTEELTNKMLIIVNLKVLCTSSSLRHKRHYQHMQSST